MFAGTRSSFSKIVTASRARSANGCGKVPGGVAAAAKVGGVVSRERTLSDGEQWRCAEADSDGLGFWNTRILIEFEGL